LDAGFDVGLGGEDEELRGFGGAMAIDAAFDAHFEGVAGVMRVLAAGISHGHGVGMTGGALERVIAVGAHGRIPGCLRRVVGDDSADQHIVLGRMMRRPGGVGPLGATLIMALAAELDLGIVLTAKVVLAEVL
jgi:hypothetical protein